MRTYYLRLTFFICTLSMMNGTVLSQTPPAEVADTLQSILDHSLPTGFSFPGAVIEVHVPGQWTWNSATGYAISGTTSGQPQTMAVSTDKFRVGSITKMMMATCILHLQEQGLLNIEDPISLYLRPSIIADTIISSSPVKIRDLLNHTSGIANSGANTTCQMNVLSNPTGAHTLEESIYCGASQGELFPPETSWTYSNTNYSILAMIIENITGMSSRDYLTQTIITPLGLTNTEIPVANEITDPHMGCYWNIGGSWVDLTIINPTTYTGWADVVSTTADLITFMQALRSGLIINNASFTLMNTQFAGANAYGLGYDFYTYSGVEYRGHYGEVANTSALFYANTSSIRAPGGYYISYNFNEQGADDINKLALPIFHYLNGGTTSSLQELTVSKYTVEVFPNPAKNVINVVCSELNAVDLQVIRLVDELGKTVFTKQNTGLTNHSIDCSAFERGVYTLLVQGAKGIEYHKVILN